MRRGASASSRAKKSEGEGKVGRKEERERHQG